LIKIIFSKGFIEAEVSKYNKNLEEEIIKKLVLQDIKTDSRQIIQESSINVNNENKNDIIHPIVVHDLLENEEHQNTIKKTQETLNIIKEPVNIQKNPSKIEIFMKEFFAENLFAKI
jgi:hypothetical protein